MSAHTESADAACLAARSALYLRPDGLVQACCASGYLLGRASDPERQTLREIWDGARADRLRAELDDGSFALGCQDCQVAIETAGRASALASHFDRYDAPGDLRYPKLLDLALSSRCNLQCIMCNGELSSSIRTQREGRPPMPAAYDDAFFEELAEFLPHAERIQFKGGEPLLAPETHRVLDLLVQLGAQPEVSLTTNGTVWSEQIGERIRDLGMEVNVSVDAVDPAVLEGIRVGVSAGALWANIDRFQQACSDAGSGFTLSFCLMTQNWHELPPFMAEVDRRGINPDIIPVVQPDRYDLTRLPPAELAEIVRALTDRRPELRTAKAGQEWDRALRRLEPVDGSPQAVEVVTHDVGDVDAGAWKGELASVSGVQPIEVVIEDEQVVTVTSPEWSAWLQPDRWPGTHENRLLDAIGASAGNAPTLVVIPRDEGVTDVRLTFELPARRAEVRLIRLPLEAVLPRRRRLFLAPFQP